MHCDSQTVIRSRPGRKPFWCLGFAQGPPPDPTPSFHSARGHPMDGSAWRRVSGHTVWRPKQARPVWHSGQMEAPEGDSDPHFHSADRWIYVVSGTWWVSSSSHFDPAMAYPLPAGTFAIDRANYPSIAMNQGRRRGRSAGVSGHGPGHEYWGR